MGHREINETSFLYSEFTRLKKERVHSSEERQKKINAVTEIQAMYSTSDWL